MNLLTLPTLGFEIGALYSRRSDVHSRFGGQQQGGISTPKDHPFIFAFTGEVGRSHGYHDFWDEKGLFHYYGEGQSGDMTYSGGNRAILGHRKDGKRLFVFQMLGHGKPYRFIGEFEIEGSYEEIDASSSSGVARKAIVFVLRPVNLSLDGGAEPRFGVDEQYPEGPATRTAVVQVRSKQWLFRRRVADMEKGCRLTGLSDLRFLRASHIKPWSKCTTDVEKLDGSNGLLLCPQADLLFDRGWITFEDSGVLVRSEELPTDVVSRIGLNLKSGRRCGYFREEQRGYLDFHRKVVFGRRYAEIKDPLAEFEIS